MYRRLNFVFPDKPYGIMFYSVTMPDHRHVLTYNREAFVTSSTEAVISLDSYHTAEGETAAYANRVSLSEQRHVAIQS